MEQREFERVSAAILALFPPLAEIEQRVGLTLYRLLAEGGPVSSDELARASGTGAAETERILAGWPGVYRDHTRYTWCAWDTLFIPELLERTALVESTCPATGRRVALTVRPDGIETASEAPCVSLVAPEPTKAAADIVSHFCCHVHFFASESTGREWVSKRPGVFLASLDQAWQLGRRRNARRYPTMQT